MNFTSLAVLFFEVICCFSVVGVMLSADFISIEGNCKEFKSDLFGAVTFSVIVKNVSQHEIKIINIRPSCSCTEVCLSSFFLCVNESVTMAGVVKGNGSIGRAEKNIFIEYALGKSEKNEIAQVKVPVYFQSPYNIDNKGVLTWTRSTLLKKTVVVTFDRSIDFAAIIGFYPILDEAGCDFKFEFKKELPDRLSIDVTPPLGLSPSGRIKIKPLMPIHEGSKDNPVPYIYLYFYLLDG